MKTKLIFLLSILGLLLSGCARHKVDNSAEATANHEAYMALAEAAGSVGQSLTRLGGIEQAAMPPQTVTEPPLPSSYGMAIPASIDWNGPIEPLVKQIAEATHYQLRVLGKAPAIPVIVSITAENASMGDILRDIGYQAGRHADVVVFPSTKTVELRYAN